MKRKLENQSLIEIGCYAASDVQIHHVPLKRLTAPVGHSVIVRSFGVLSLRTRETTLFRRPLILSSDGLTAAGDGRSMVEKKKRAIHFGKYF